MLGADPLGQRREALELLVEELRVRLVGGREVGPEPGELEALVRRHPIDQRSTASGSRSPSRPMPVSYLTWTRGRTPSSAPRSATRSANSGRHAATSESAASATSSSASVSAPMVRIRASGSWRRSSAASAAAATASQLAPPASAARAHSTAPWP